jgi:hypothetical protein
MQLGLPCTGCGGPCGTFTAATGLISDGPADYQSNAECSWLIAPTGASRVTITFSEVDSELYADWITVYQCGSFNCESRLQLGRFSGFSNLRTYTSTTGYLLVEFDSNFAFNGHGFVASWTTPQVPTNVCIHTLSSHLHDENFDIDQ